MAGEWSVASVDTRSNFITTRAGALNSSTALIYDFEAVRPAAGQRPRVGLRMRRRKQMGPAKIYFISFGILTIAGGIIGYVKAASLPSIIAGGITGILLLVAAFLLPEHRAAGLATAFIVSLLLGAQFVPKFLRTGRVMPAGMMSILSMIGIIVAIVAWLKK